MQKIIKFANDHKIGKEFCETSNFGAWYMKEQEENLITTEYQKQEFINSYFVEKEDKDNIPITYSIAN